MQKHQIFKLPGALPLLIALGLAACMSGEKRPPADFGGALSIAVLPFIHMESRPSGRHGGSYQSTQTKERRYIEQGASGVMTAHMVSGLRKNLPLNVELLPETDRYVGFESYFPGQIKTDADLIVIGRIYRFIERKGSDYSISAPASVAFDIRIIRAKDGAVVFYEEYDETQHSLSYNLLTFGKFLRRKGRWITAGEMARSALDDSIETLADAFK